MPAAYPKTPTASFGTSLSSFAGDLPSVEYNGHFYALLGGGDPEGKLVVRDPSYDALPPGWELAPADTDVVSEVVASHCWSTNALHLSTGSFHTKNWGSGAGNAVEEVCWRGFLTKKESESQTWCYKATGPFTRILIRRACNSQGGDVQFEGLPGSPKAYGPGGLVGRLRPTAQAASVLLATHHALKERARHKPEEVSSALSVPIEKERREEAEEEPEEEGEKEVSSALPAPIKKESKKLDEVEKEEGEEKESLALPAQIEKGKPGEMEDEEETAKKKVTLALAPRVIDQPDAGEIDEIIALFRYFDKDGDGCILQSEFEGVMRRMGMSHEELQTLFDIFDANKDGVISLEEFRLQIFEGSTSSALQKLTSDLSNVPTF